MAPESEYEPEAPKAFLAEPIEQYLAPLLEDLASYEASQRIPAALASALADRYAIQEELGHGGMATVYLAFDHALARSVAIKVLSAPIADGLSAERFVREIEITARLQHSRIVPVHDRGEAKGYLYYVMRHFESGSLRDRIARDGQLAIESTVAIARDIASALDFAHERGVVHRDVKPENIFLEGDTAYLADFGVARLVDAVGRDRLTRTGIIIGTAQYMSPEQAEAGLPIDRRADVYSLACVIYEMLAGEPPFTGPSQRDVLAKHLAAKVPDLSVVRRTVTPAMQQVLEVALRKSAVDRYATAGEFVRAFERAVGKSAERLPSRLSRWVPRRQTVAIAAVIVLSVIALASAGRWIARAARSALAAGSRPDTARIAVYPFQHDRAVGTEIQEHQVIGDAIRRWRGLTVVDEVRMSETLEHETRARNAIRARALAAKLGAGRFVRGEISRVRDSIRIHAALYDTNTDTLIRDANVRVSMALSDVDSAAADLADQLLFGVRDRSIRLQCRKTQVPSAYTACASAHGYARGWQLAQADSAFALAEVLDPQYVHVHVWLAQVRHWREEPVARWRSVVERGFAHREALERQEQIRAEALFRTARGETELACKQWEQLVGVAPVDFTAWYSLGWCLRSDELVVRDGRSPSGWRFRSSYHRALVAYRRAFELQPSILRAFQDRMFAGVREMFVTSPSVLREGYSTHPESRRFLGRAAWIGDSLAFIPFQADSVHAARPQTRLATTHEAVQRQRAVFAEIATSWVAAQSSSAAAMEALAIALEMLNDPAAPDTLARARSLSTTDSERLRIAAHEVWLRLKFAIPDDDQGVRAARQLTDSLLQFYGGSETSHPGLLAGLAALTGRASLGAKFARRAALSPEGHALAAVARPASALLTFASIGGPSDSLRALERQVALMIESTLPPADRRSARQEWLARAATLAFPDLALSGPSAPVRGDDPLLDAQLAVLTGDRSAATRYVSDVRRARRLVRPADLSYDGICPEAELLVHLGNHAAAVEWIDPVLQALPLTAPLSIADAPAAGSFVRAMALRATLAARAGDQATARRWAKTVLTLWSDPDPFLQPTVGRLREISR